MGIASQLETHKLLRRCRDLLETDVGKPHPRQAGVGLAASGGFGQIRQKRFTKDFEALVRLGERAAKLGLTINEEDVA